MSLLNQQPDRREKRAGPSVRTARVRNCRLERVPGSAFAPRPVKAALPHPDVELELLIPYDRGELVSLAHARARVTDTRYDERGTWLTVMGTKRVAEQLKAAVTADAAV